MLHYSHKAKILTFEAHCEDKDEVNPLVSEPHSLPTELRSHHEVYGLKTPTPSPPEIPRPTTRKERTEPKSWSRKGLGSGGLERLINTDTPSLYLNSHKHL